MALVDEISALYAPIGLPSIPPEQLGLSDAVAGVRIQSDRNGS